MEAGYWPKTSGSLGSMNFRFGKKATWLQYVENQQVWLVGDGRRVRFWHDVVWGPWVGGVVPDLFLMVEDKDPFVFSYLSIMEDSQLQFS